VPCHRPDTKGSAVIVDSHAHIFPALAGACGFPDPAAHLHTLQLYIAHHGEPVRRLRDHAIVPEAAEALTDGRLESPDGVREANFRVGLYGRFEWDWQGETYYRSFLPPSLQEMVSPIGFLLQSMARAGVDVAILQNARLYGRLNELFADAVSRHPNKLIGLADVVETEADTPDECARLTHAVRDLDLRGVYYANRGLIHDHYRHGFDDPKFDPYWETVRSLGIPVFWELAGVPLPATAAYLREIDRLNRWCDRFPTIPAVLTHGVSPNYLDGDIAEPIAELFSRDQVMIEILYPIHWGRTHDYPYPELRAVLARLIKLVGPRRLIWGSDMPNVERNCTYRQSLDYLRHGLNGLTSGPELDAILGENVLRLVRKST
jgi:predicted TIM-barrel fold metal-dependent hydrolase